MSGNKYTHIRLADEQRGPLETIRHANQGSKERKQRTWIVLMTDENRPEGGSQGYGVPTLFMLSARALGWRHVKGH